MAVGVDGRPNAVDMGGGKSCRGGRVVEKRRTNQMLELYESVIRYVGTNETQRKIERWR